MHDLDEDAQLLGIMPEQYGHIMEVCGFYNLSAPCKWRTKKVNQWLNECGLKTNLYKPTNSEWCFLELGIGNKPIGPEDQSKEAIVATLENGCLKWSTMTKQMLMP